MAGKAIMVGLETKKHILRGWSVAWCVVFLLTCLRTASVMFHHVALDYNEGWNALLAGWGTGAGGQQLYASKAGFVFNNYPPLSFVILGWIGKLGGDVIIAGRIISCLSVFLSTILIARLIKLITGNKNAAWAGAFIFLATLNTAFYTYFGMNDPQWLAQFFMLSGLYILFSPGYISLVWWRLLLSALLIVLGGFTKHNLVALPLALCVWMFFLDKRKMILWASMLVGLLGVGFFICYAVYGAGFFHDVFLHSRIVRVRRIVHGVDALLLMGGLVTAGIGMAYYYRRTKTTKDGSLFVLFFLAFSLLFGLMGSMGEGVDYNIMFEVLVASTLLCGIGFAKLLDDDRSNNAIFYVCLVISFPLFFLFPMRSLTFYHEVKYVQKNEYVWNSNIQLMKAHKNSTLCTDMALCYWAHLPYSVDIFNLEQALKVGGETSPLQNVIATHKFALVQLYGSREAYSTKSVTLDEWLRQAGYRPVLTGAGRILLLGYEPH